MSKPQHVVLAERRAVVLAQAKAIIAAGGGRMTADQLRRCAALHNEADELLVKVFKERTRAALARQRALERAA